jgi:hypothetical protein
VSSTFLNGVSESCLNPKYVSAEDMGIDLETKRCLSRILQAQEYHRTAKDSLRFVNVTLARPTSNKVS